MSDTQPLDPALPTSLARPEAYPEDPSAAAGVHEIQTHLSYVFLTGDRVYKVKKSVDVGFASFVTRASRNADCERELRLNRRLAPDVYLGVAPIEARGAGFAVGSIDPTPPTLLDDSEHCVVMRRLPESRDASSLLDAGELDAEHVERTAVRIANFHHDQRLGVPAPFPKEDWLARIWKPVAANFDSLDLHGGPPLDAAAVARLRDASTSRFQELQLAFEQRRVEGLAVDGHGDLHLEHVWFETPDAWPIVIDCLEFDDALRQIDAASEVAFLAMDLAFRGRTDLAERWLARYAAEADDFGLYDVVDFFMSYRAAVRGKVEAIAARDEHIPKHQRGRSAELASRRIAFATGLLAARPVGRVILVGGIVGAGKSSVAALLASETDAVVIASDRVRRLRLAESDTGGPPSADAGPGWQQGRYTPEARGRVYEDVLKRAEPVVRSGRTVVLDASWSARGRREMARDWAAARGASTHFVEVRCGREETLRRLEARSKAGRDASEAGPEIYDAFAASYDAVSDREWPVARRWTVHTDRAGWQEDLRARVREEIGQDEESPDV